MQTFQCRCVKVQQTASGQSILLFGAPAVHINFGGGLPRKRQLAEGAIETTGFQREVNDKRLQSLAAFYAEPRNTVQNPVLAASTLTDTHNKAYG